ncbi:peptide-methionine (S)-S-oxide reductase MsrA [Cohaesibacter sp. CAU 1516]|uniref:peptide-methionine (S)-S-oxide reductase MsrA n=1 Tax=Cohaesibacter sp. CAU 1516 TaxID=2576038 RepID=UPI0010FE5C6E|nr:peptide-methionine (S)-S-oxide reductase MsrA [Cohaesibacter sp. CAU 1516]TLP47246.1 peptide-methionine (S)-S-oxide reductase MsrA [Cohaesibacter sp. CAU 1516]
MFGLTRKKLDMPTKESALPGRVTPIETASTHYVLGSPLKGPFPEGLEMAIIGMGCFWGAERAFWQLDGVYTTAVGYSAGLTPNPTYEEVCTGGTGHNEVVLVVFDPARLSYRSLLKTFWEQHDPTQGMRQGNDIGTQYRSGIYTFSDDQAKVATGLRREYQTALKERGHGTISTEIIAAEPFYYAESYHQQYLAKNPGGYCGLGGTGVSCPMPLA